MRKRLLALLLCVVTVLGLFAAPASAASSEEEALGEIDIYSGGTKMTYLSINGRNRELVYTYYNYVDSTGQTKQIPAYCVNPDIEGVPQTVAPGESIKYMADEIGTDPKAVGIVAHGYPTRSLEELHLENAEQAYYATKMALWCYLLSNWDINDLKVNPSLSGVELQRAQKILAAAKDIYVRGTRWNEVPQPRVTCLPDRDTAYEVTIDGKTYKQQIFTFWSETWICNYRVDVAFALPDEVPEGTRIVDLSNRDITFITTEDTGNGFAGQFKVLYPADQVEGKTGSVRLSFRTDVYKYGIFYATCMETDEYGQLQDYLVDTDPTTEMRLSAYSNYEDGGTVIDNRTKLKILKLETGTKLPLSGALFEVVDPEGATVGVFSTDDDGEIELPLTLEGNYTVIERAAPPDHLLSEEPAQNVKVEYGETATLTFYNAPYGNLEVRKVSDTGDHLPGVLIQIKHIESGVTYTQETDPSGAAFFSELQPGGYEVRELAGIPGWQADTDTVQTVNVVSGDTSHTTIINRELPGLRIIKYDRKNHAVMPDVTFAVYRDNEFLGNYKTDQFGEILLTDVEPGTYRAFEADTGDEGYVLDTTPQEIELRAGDGIRELLFFNDMKPGLRLVKVDATDPSKVIPNAVFEIRSVAGDYGPEEFTTDENGEIDLSHLPVGAYVVTEKSCPGHIIDEAQRIIQLDPNEDAQFVFTNSPEPSLHLIKLSADSSRLAGVTFRIARIEDGTHYLDRTTDAQGEILITGLEPGVYSVKETATTGDHILNPKEYHVQLFPGKSATLIVENQKRPNLTVYKYDADTGAPVADTVFLVTAADGHSVDEIRTDASGKAELKDLLPGVYEVSEKSVPSPYLKDAPDQLVTLYPNRDRTIYFENHKKPNLTVNKVDSITGAPIQGAKFQVWYASNNTSTGELNDLGIFYSDENGQFTINAIQDGWYKVTELEPAAGYSIKEPATQEIYIKGGESKELTFENIPLSALVVWKYDSVTGAAVEGAVFQVKYLGSTSGTGGTVIGTYKTGPSGSFTVTGLEAGTYIVEELASDSGHVIDTAPQTAYLSGKEQDVVQLYFGNSPKGALLVKKVDASNGKPISDVEFLVTTSDGTVVGDANGRFVTDSAGTFLVEGIDPGTTLVVKETRAKDGYLLDDTPQTAMIKAGQTVPLEFRNQPMGNLIINKLDSVTRKPLEGVEFQLTYADGSYVDAEGGTLSSKGLYYTDENGQIILSGITGTIVATETKTIEGYTIHEETRSQTVVINPNDTQTLVFYNDPVGGVEIIKADEADKSKRLGNATFEVRRMDDALVDTVTTDKNGRVFVALEDGAYYAVEIEAPEGYKLDDTPHYFEVVNGKTEPLKITNQAVSGILIHKTDSTTGEGIYGMTFLLYDSSNTPIGQYTSDDRGYVCIEDLEAGRYYLRELENEGYVPDTQKKTVYVKSGKTTEVEWENTPITGQIQITKTSADYNSMNGWPAGTPIPNTVFEIYNYRTGKLVDTVRTDKNGVAVSKPLPLGRYKVVESQAAEFYGMDKTPIEVELEFAGQIVKMAMTNKSLYTNVSIKKTGYAEVMPGQSIQYDLSGIANNSTTSLTSFFWRDILPTQAVRLDKIITGTYNVPGNYKVVYQTNLSNGAWRTMYDNLSTMQNHTLDASPAALGLASNEYVTAFMVSFGVVPANFRQVEAPRIYCSVLPQLTGGTQFVNQADVGGIVETSSVSLAPPLAPELAHSAASPLPNQTGSSGLGSQYGQWSMATSRWVTRVYKPSEPLPRTGY